MKNGETCPYEHDVVLAARSERWSDVLRAHAAQCAVCSEALAFVRTMGSIASEAAEHAPRLDPRVVWMRAQFAQRQERISHLDLFALLGMSLAAVAGSLIALVFAFPVLFDRFSRTFGDVTLGPIVTLNLPIIFLAGILFLIWLFTLDAFFTER